MSRPKYTISTNDFTYAYQWCDDFTLSPSSFTDHQQRLQARRFLEQCDDHLLLNSWCEKWLTSEQWTRMKNMIRQSRRRRKSLYKDQHRTITLDYDAWLVLRTLARKQSMSFSETIKKFLYKKAYTDKS